MNEFIFELLKLLIMVFGAIVTYRIIPWIKAKTTAEQRKEAEYWTRVFVKLAEQIYLDKGQGALKKENVIKWLNDNQIKITLAQVNALIDVIVEEFNSKGWE